ncbi:hypothetical protein [Streptomyces sp. DSM 40907]|uniref:hypothetical protein n=1 Tax=Streptomyces kutzneri TaxID=3051179 RepID=UPI0028D6BF94|nr:hypothetical protein [Streptomyces sp. DSM 40907]
MSNATGVLGILALVGVLLAAGFAARRYVPKRRGPVARPDGRVRRTGPSPWIKGLALSVAVALPTFITGAVAGFSQVGEICGVEAGRERADSVAQTRFPLSTVCGWKDGTTIDLVPAWVNPLLCLCAAAAVVCAFMALSAVIKNKKELVHD